MNTDPIPYESRLVKRLRIAHDDRIAERARARIILEVGVHHARAAITAAGGDRRALRGVPVLAHGGAGGEIGGTRPDRALIAKERRHG